MELISTEYASELETGGLFFYDYTERSESKTPPQIFFHHHSLRGYVVDLNKKDFYERQLYPHTVQRGVEDWHFSDIPPLRLDFRKALLLKWPIDATHYMIGFREFILDDCLLKTIPQRLKEESNFTDCLHEPFIDWRQSIYVLSIKRNSLDHLFNDEMPINYFKKLIYLNLSSNNIFYFSDELDIFKQLVLLDVSHNQLSEWPKCFNQMTSLTHLNLSFNHLTTINDSDIVAKNEYFLKLTHLFLNDNQLTIISDNFLPQFPNLKLLSLHNNLLRHIPKTISELNDLRHFSTNGNKNICQIPDIRGPIINFSASHFHFRILPDKFNFIRILNWTKLTSLSLDDCGYVIIPKSIIQILPQLFLLSLCHNEIGDISSIRSKSLRELYLSNNPLELNEESFQHLPKLKVLDIRNNKRMIIFYVNILFDNLLTLKLCGNSLISFPSELRCPSLTHLYMSHNKLNYMPVSNNLPNLTTIDLSYNLIGIIGRCAPLDTENWEWINLSHNRLKSIPEQVKFWSKCQHFDISTNHLNSLPDSLWELPNLKFLNLADNELESLMVPSPNRLRYLNLSDNQYAEMIPFKNLENLEEFHFSQKSGIKISRMQGLEELKHLRVLNLAYNRFTGLDGFPRERIYLPNFEFQEIYGGVDQMAGKIQYTLQKLDMSFNNFHFIDPAVERYFNLRELNLEGNPLVDISQPLWCPSLQKLKLGDKLRNKPLLPFVKEGCDLNDLKKFNNSLIDSLNSNIETRILRRMQQKLMLIDELESYLKSQTIEELERIVDLLQEHIVAVNRDRQIYEFDLPLDPHSKEYVDDLQNYLTNFLMNKLFLAIDNHELRKRQEEYLEKNEDDSSQESQEEEEEIFEERSISKMKQKDMLCGEVLKNLTNLPFESVKKSIYNCGIPLPLLSRSIEASHAYTLS
ncbi:hypothetical protein SNEBB_002896 [Seison nebaliae]|nr:hypothetical protein SNEBB_002896 [Seison nebaliae]